MGRYLITGANAYVGSRLALYLVQQGHSVRGLVRSSDTEIAQELAAQGVSIWQGDLCKPDSLVGIANGIEHVINVAGCSPLDLGSARKLFLDGNRYLLAACSRARSLRSYVVASNLSPYGDRGDAWLSEESEIAPSFAWGELTVEAELALISMLRTYRFPIMLARLGVVYGEGRDYTERLLQQSTLCIGDGLNYVSHIAINDLVYILDQIAVFGQPGAIYNVVDDLPIRIGDLYQFLAERLGMNTPRFIPKQVALCSGIDANVVGISTASTRVLNQRLRDELQISFQYPSIYDWFHHQPHDLLWELVEAPKLGINISL